MDFKYLEDLEYTAAWRSQRQTVSTLTEPGGAEVLSGRTGSEQLEGEGLRGRRGHHA